MIWELDALRVLAKNQTVPGIALQDAISEIEKLRVKLKAKEVTIENQQRLMQERAEAAEAEAAALRAELDAANEDAERLAVWLQVLLEAFVGDRDINIGGERPLDVITAHRARVNGKLEGGGAVKDSPDKEA